MEAAPAITVASNSVPANSSVSRVLSDRSIVSDLVPDAPDGGNRALVTELAAELAHMHVHGARVPRKRVTPDALEQLIAGQHQAAVIEQLPQQVELLWSELHLVAADCDLASPGVDLDGAVFHHGLGRPAALLGLGGAAQDRLDASDQLARVERLGQVVVGAHLEPDDLVDVVVAGGQHQDWHVRGGADLPAHLEPVDVGQHQVEHHQVGLGVLGLHQRLAAVAGDLDLVARVLQVHRDEGCNVALVLDDQDLLSHRPYRSRRARRGSATDRERLSGLWPMRPLAGAEAAAERPVGVQPGRGRGGTLDVTAAKRGGRGRRAPGGGDLDRPRGRGLVGHALAGVVDEPVLGPRVLPAADAEVAVAVVTAVADRDRALADGAVGDPRAPLLERAGAVDGGDLSAAGSAVAVRGEPDGSRG